MHCALKYLKCALSNKWKAVRLESYTDIIFLLADPKNDQDPQYDPKSEFCDPL